MPRERDDGSSAIDDIKAALEAERGTETAAGKDADDADEKDLKPAKKGGKAVVAAAEPAEEPDDEEGEGEDAEEGEEDPKAKAAKAKADAEKTGKKDWRDIQLGKTRGQLKDERAAREGLETQVKQQADELAKMRSAVEKLTKGEEVKPEDLARAKTPEEAKAEAIAAAKAEMTAEAEAKAFARAADKLFDDGVTAFGEEEFGEARTNIIGFGNDMGMFDNNRSRVDFIQQLLDAVDNPERVLFLMGQDPEEAERIIGLPERKRIAAFVKLSTARPRKPAPVSEVPEPIETVNGNRTAAPLSYRGPKTSDADMDRLFDQTQERIANRRRG